jgi:gluconate 2-dehydrogenase gamma chain
MPVTRRTFLQTSGGAALVPAAVGAEAATPVRPPSRSVATAPAAYQFFRADESPFIEAAVLRLIPPDEVGPSAIEAGVPGYIDKQLAGAWGAGERLYRSGPWQQGAPTQGYQLPFTPAELFRTALRGVRADLERAGRGPFEKLAGPEQDAYLTLLQTTPRDLGGVPGNVFFESLLGMTIEGYFSDPVYGGNLGMAAWKMIGFPGAYGAYYDLVDKHGQRFEGEPRSLAQDGRGTIRIMPAMPAHPGMAAAGHGDAHAAHGVTPERVGTAKGR